MSAIQIPLTHDEWRQIDAISARQGLFPAEYLRDLLLKDLQKNQHLADRSGNIPRIYRGAAPCKI